MCTIILVWVYKSVLTYQQKFQKPGSQQHQDRRGEVDQLKQCLPQHMKIDGYSSKTLPLVKSFVSQNPGHQYMVNRQLCNVHSMCMSMLILELCVVSIFVTRLKHYIHLQIQCLSHNFVGIIVLDLIQYTKTKQSNNNCLGSLHSWSHLEFCYQVI